MRFRSFDPVVRQMLLTMGLGQSIFGDVFFVAGNDIQAREWLDGKVPASQLFSGINEAVDAATASRGDLIVVAPGHTESVAAAAGIAFDKIGLNVLGLGTGAMRPTITIGTAITATVTITAASTWLKNLVFASGIDNLTNGINISAADVTLQDIETRDNTSTIHCDDFIITTDAADRLQVLDWVHRAGAGKTGGQTAISIVGGDGVVIVPKYIDGDFATACIENVTTACDSLEIFGRASRPAYLRTRNSADVIVTAVATTKGRVGPFIYARVKDNAANITEAFVGADMSFYTPLQIVNLDGERGMESNIAASTDA